MPELIQNDALYAEIVAANTAGSPPVTDWDAVHAALNEAHLDRADNTYLEGAVGLDVQDDQEAREALDASAHDAVENDELGTEVLNTSTATVGGADIPVYAGGNIVDSVDYDDFKRGVFDAVQAGTAFALSGQVPPENAIAADDFNAEHVDPLMLIEASKLTGEKHF